MLELSRTVRFCLSADGSLARDAAVSNSFAAWPPMRGLGRYYELVVTCRGQADAVTGYFINIKQIDVAAREAALPLVAAAAQGQRSGGLGDLLRDMITALHGPLDGHVHSAELRLGPVYSLKIEASDMSSVLVSHQYEFAAAHRLNVPSMSEEDNRRTFGKCNNEAGHGHNYRVEVTVRCPIGSDGGVLPVEHLDELVEREVVQKLDHKNLDVDVPEFRDAAMNTSVENIVRTIYDMLREPVKTLGVELDQVRVWETSKTVCAYRG